MKLRILCIAAFFLTSVCFGQRMRMQKDAGLTCVATPSIVTAGETFQLSMTTPKAATGYLNHFEWYGPHLGYGTDSSKPTVNTKGMTPKTYTYFGEWLEIDTSVKPGKLVTITRCNVKIQVN